MKLYTDAELAQILDKDIFHLIGDTADELNLDCYVVGGYVRDLFLERPSNDIDVVVVGSGIQVANALRKKMGRKANISVFKNFGTAQVKYKGMEIEFVGARRESYSHDSRKPIVEDGTLEDDQNRRDFTVNAMAIQLNRAHFGELVDGFEEVLNRFGVVACLYGVNHAMGTVVIQNFFCRGGYGGVYCGQLNDDVLAMSVGANHFLHPADLALDFV